MSDQVNGIDSSEQKNRLLHRQLLGMLTEMVNVTLIGTVQTHELNTLEKRSKKQLEKSIATIVKDYENMSKEFDGNAADITKNLKIILHISLRVRSEYRIFFSVPR